LALVLALGIGGMHEEGYAARYAPGVMGRVARVRGTAPADCMVALTSARRITGRQWVLVVGRRTGVARWCKVVDLPRDEDRQALEERGIIVELDQESARAVCGSVVDPPKACPVWVFL